MSSSCHSPCVIINSTHQAVIEYRRITEKEREGEEEDALEGDEDLMMGQVQRSLTCPITLKELENPMKNTTCGHIYSKAGKEKHIIVSALYCTLYQHCSCIGTCALSSNW